MIKYEARARAINTALNPRAVIPDQGLIVNCSLERKSKSAFKNLGRSDIFNPGAQMQRDSVASAAVPTPGG